jgi:cell division septal protein FtsQ
MIRYQNPKTKKEPKKITCWIFLIIVILFFIWFFRFSGFFQIKQVLIDDSVYKKQIESLINKNIKNNKNLFSFPSSYVEQEIKKQIPNISEVRVYKSPPDALKVVYIERKPMLILIQGNKKYIIDYYGVAFRFYLDKDKDLTKIIDERSKQINIGDKVLTSGFLSFVKNLSKNLEASLSAKITKVLIKQNVFEVIVYTNKDFYMIFDTTTSSSSQIADAKKAIEIIGNKKIDYLDLRIPGKVYYK